MKEGCGRSTIRATMTGRSPQLVYTSVQLQLQVRQVLKDQWQKILMKDWDCQNIFRATKIDNSRLYGTRYESRSPMVLVKTSRNLPEWLTKNGTLTSFRRRSNRCTGGGPSTNEDGLALRRLLGSLTSCDGQRNRLFGWRVPRRRLKT